MFAPETLYPNEHTTSEVVLFALRELLSEHPAEACSDLETLSEMLYAQCYLPFRPDVDDVEAAREALLVEGEVLP